MAYLVFTWPRLEDEGVEPAEGGRPFPNNKKKIAKNPLIARHFKVGPLFCLQLKEKGRVFEVLEVPPL